MSSIGKGPGITEFPSAGGVGASPSPDLAVPQSRNRSDAAGRGRCPHGPCGDRARSAPLPRRQPRALRVPSHGAAARTQTHKGLVL